MLTRIKEQPAIGKMIARLDQLPARDRQALLALAIALFITVIYFGVWKPSVSYSEQARNSRENAEQLLAWMQANEASIRSLSSVNTGGSSMAAERPEDGRALMALVTRSAVEAGLSLQRFEPGSENTIRVWLDSVPYADVAAWLEQLNHRHGVLIDQASMDKSNEPGQVSVRLTLTI